MKAYKTGLKELPERFSFKGKEKICTQFLVYDADTINVVFPIENEARTFLVRLEGFDAPELKLKKDEIA